MRYSLQTLLLAVAVVASATAAFGVVGFAAALIGLGLGAFVAAAKTKLEAIVAGAGFFCSWWVFSSLRYKLAILLGYAVLAN